MQAKSEGPLLLKASSMTAQVKADLITMLHLKSNVEQTPDFLLTFMIAMHVL